MQFLVENREKICKSAKINAIFHQEAQERLLKLSLLLYTFEKMSGQEGVKRRAKG